MVSLNELWFILVAVLFIGFFFLEGFDFGVGMATRFLGRNELERRVMINTIGPFWDANEVWLLTGGGAIFAASKLVCHDVQRILHSVCLCSSCIDRTRSRV